MTFTSKPAKLLICMVGRHRGETLMKVAKSAGARGGTIALGRTMADSFILQALSLADVSQDIVFTLLADEAETVIPAIKAEALAKPGKLGGAGVVLNAGMFIRNNSNPASDAGSKIAENRSVPMNSGKVMITVIVNSGYADDVMAAARKAGAKGGTILNARGTGTAEDVKFFGIVLVPEKEMLMIVTETENASGIVEAINSVPHLSEPGGGIVFTTQVEDFFVLGK